MPDFSISFNLANTYPTDSIDKPRVNLTTKGDKA